MRRWPLAGILIIGAGVWLWRATERPGVPVLKVSRGAFLREVRAEGYLQAVKTTPILAPVDNDADMKIAWLADDGSRVSAGSPVVRFDAAEAERQLQEGLRSKATAESKIAAKKAEEGGTIRNLDRDADMAGVELDHARQFQSTDSVLFSRNQIIESEVDEKLATQKKDTADAVRGVHEKLSSTGIELLEIERRQAEMAIDQARHSLDSLVIRAPHDGILVLKRNWRGFTPKVGDVVWSGQAIAELPRLDELEAQVFVLEADAGGLHVDRPATLTVEAHPERTYKAVTSQVDSLAKPRMRDVPVQYFAATLKLERTDPAIMKPGQRVVAELVLDQSANVISVPRSAVFEKSGKRIVYRWTGRGFGPVEVAIGPVALGRVVIDKGLADGDIIALCDPTGAKPETKTKKPVPEGPTE